ncbi:MAG: hypothetical protein MZV65_41250 [Chromatiales bacterium]|nr:hypothetical protein [Chromatiales bacterium]
MKAQTALPPSVRKEEAVEIEGRFQEGNPNANLKLSLFKGNEEEVTCRRMDGTVGENLAQVPNPLFNIEKRSFEPLEPGRSMAVH